MQYLVMDGDVLLLKPDAGWAWQGWPGRAPITSSQKILWLESPAGAKPVVLPADLEQTFREAVQGKCYYNPPFTTGQVVVPVQFEVDEPSFAKCWTVKDRPSAPHPISGRFAVGVAAPATDPSGKPDPKGPGQRTGRWRVVKANQQFARIDAPSSRRRGGSRAKSKENARPTSTTSSPGQESSRKAHPAENHAEATPARLPFIDVHCHTTGQELARTAASPDKMRWFEFSNKFLGYFDITRVLFYMTGDEARNILTLLSAMPRGPADAGCIVPLLLDLGYTPLVALPDLVAGTSRLPGTGDRVPRLAPDRDGWYGPEEAHIWLDRAMLPVLIERLASRSKQHPGRILPFVPFDPRRTYPRSGLEYVRDAIESKGHVGVKMYARCGWTPDKNHQLYGPRGEDLDTRLAGLYRFVTKAENDLPIVNHTTPGGFPLSVALVYPEYYESTRGYLQPAPQADIVLVDAPQRPASDLDASGWSKFLVSWCAHSAAKFCHYVQRTCSPYSWEPVLDRFPTLRLNFAHTGSEAAALCRYGDDRLRGVAPEVAVPHPFTKAFDYLSDHPVLASGAHFRSRLFRSLVVKKVRGLTSLISKVAEGGVDLLLWQRLPPALRVPAKIFSNQVRKRVEAEVGAQLEPMIEEEINSRWAKWLSAWEHCYPYDWLEKIIHLMRRHPNVYSDLSYFVSSAAVSPGSTGLLRRLAEEARRQPVLASRILIGTDWYISELDHINVGGAWAMVRAALDNPSEDDPLWTAWAKTNALRYLNLGRRCEALEKFWGGATGLPQWWQSVRAFYEQPG